MSGQAAVERGRSARLRPPPVPGLIGRGRELAELAQALASSPTVVLIEGEAGIGKSRLLREYLASPAARGHTALVAYCPPFRQPQTLGPVTDALRRATDGVAGLPLTNLSGALRPLFPEWACDLPPPPEPVEDTTTARHRLFRALGELLGCLDAATIITEDMHWADEATLEFLIYLASGPPSRPNLVVTYRPEDMPAGSLLPRLSRLAAGSGGLRVTLGPLDEADTGALVSSMLAEEQVSARFAAFVHQRTEGVPLAVEELVRLMADRADLALRDGGWVQRNLPEIAVPPTVRDAVLERAGRLSAQAQAVLRSAAVLAEPADEAMLVAVSTLPAGRARAGLAETLHSGLLAEDARGLVSFRHALACQAVYEAIPGPDRRVLHRYAGLALEGCSPRPAARLARHFRQAGQTAKWLRYAEGAAELALASGDEATSVALLRDLIEHARADPRGYRSAVALLDKITFASITDPACFQDLQHRLRSLLGAGTGAPAERAQVRCHLGRILGYTEELEEARAELERAIPDLAGQPARAAWAMNMLGWPHDTVSPASTHLRWLRRAERAASTLEPAERLPLLVQRVTALLLLGEEEGWRAAAEIAAAPAWARDKRQVNLGQLNTGDLAMTWGRYADAGRWLASAQKLADARHYRRYGELIISTRVHLDWLTGAWDGLAERARRVADDDESQLNSRLEASLVIGLVEAATGAKDRAEDRFRYVLAERQQRGGPYFIMEPAAALARLLLGDDRTGEALSVTSGPAAVVAAKRTWVWAADIAPARVEALIAAGRVDEAAEMVAAFGHGLRGRNAPAPKAAVILCGAMLAEARGDNAGAAGLFGRAALAWQLLPRPFDALLAREQQAGCWLAAGDVDRCVWLLTEVFNGLSRLGASGDAARVARRLREHGIAVARGPRGGRRGYGNQLSPRELDVARVLVAGRTNREIAGQLFLSPKTVARHLDSAMRKLGVRSRTALAVRLVEDGLISGNHRVGLDADRGQASGAGR
jgi:DNA-binding CsgD family transcriptional regulator